MAKSKIKLTPAMELHEGKIRAAKKINRIASGFSPEEVEEIFEMARPTPESDGDGESAESGAE